ncbi:MAG: hypothetical protein K8I30_02715, partial [Anaerolineae bacterium]|nr:hypothetical protein [Anaerolineae bacterium]
MSGASNIRLSAIDEERFGIRTARVDDVTVTQLPQIDDFCRTNAVKFLIARCNVTERLTAQAMETQGFLLMDTLLYFARLIPNASFPQPDDTLAVRPVRDGEADAVGALARRAFHDYGGHYHADNRLDRDLCDVTYESWAYRSCTVPSVADGVLVAEMDGRIAGFTTLRIHNPELGEVPLYGVD